MLLYLNNCTCTNIQMNTNLIHMEMVSAFMEPVKIQWFSQKEDGHRQKGNDQ